MFSYIAYGLGISATLPLPELMPAETSADVVVRFGKVNHAALTASAGGYFWRATSEEVCLLWEEVGAFLVHGGTEIVVDPAPGVEERVLRLFILGPALSVLLHQRGFVSLHASAVAVHGRVAAFLGGSGWGKSTLTAALYTRGHSVVTDDVMAVQVEREPPSVWPGFPQLKLWPDAALSLGYVPEQLPRLHPLLEKRALRAPCGFQLTPFPLKRLYVLAEGVSQQIVPLQPQDALLELVRHSHGVRLLQILGAASHLQHCTRLVNRVTVCRLQRPRSLPMLPALARFVEDDLEHAS